MLENSHVNVNVVIQVALSCVWFSCRVARHLRDVGHFQGVSDCGLEGMSRMLQRKAKTPT